MIGSFHNRQGMTLLKCLLMMSLTIMIAAIAVPAAKIALIHLNQVRIRYALKNLEGNIEILKINGITHEKIKKYLLRRFAIQNMPEVTPDDITITDLKDSLRIQIRHHYQQKIFPKTDFHLEVDESVDLPAWLLK